MWIWSWFYSCWGVNACLFSYYLFSYYLLLFPLLFSYFITKPNTLKMQISVSTEPICSRIHYDQQRQTEEFVGNKMYLGTQCGCVEGEEWTRKKLTTNWSILWKRRLPKKTCRAPTWQIGGKDSPVGIMVFCQVSSEWIALA